VHFCSVVVRDVEIERLLASIARQLDDRTMDSEEKLRVRRRRRCSGGHVVLFGVGSVVVLSLVVIQCAIVVQVETIKADMARIYRQIQQLQRPGSESTGASQVSDYRPR